MMAFVSEEFISGCFISATSNVDISSIVFLLLN